MVYLMETNANVYSWLVNFYKQNPIPKVCTAHHQQLQCKQTLLAQTQHSSSCIS
jgi:hypothetical protein